MKATGLPMDNPISLLGLGLVGVLFAFVATKLGARLRDRDRGLKTYFRRLGELSPESPCPCALSGQRYSDCCRPRDVERLEADVRNYLFTHWMRRSGGRARSRSMKTRIEDFPLPQVTLPPWVASPQDYHFPVDQETLRNWSPHRPETDTAEPVSIGDDIPI